MRHAERLPNTDFRYDIRLIDRERVSVGNGRIEGVRIASEPGSEWTVVVCLDAHAVCRQNGRETRLRTGHGIFLPPNPYEIDYYGGSELLGARFMTAALAETCEALGAPDALARVESRGEPLTFLVPACGVSRVARLWLERSADNAIPEPARARIDQLHEDLLLAEAAASLIRAAEEMADRAAADRAKAERAVAFMLANIAAPIGPSQIARGAGLSIRALQYVFRAVHGVTPGVYLRNLRLERARALLLDLGDESSVADVARACGLHHLGEFGAAYRARFGERPSETLRRGG
ncbi:AraC family transcriptional regulator [Alsobacter sp. SYSU M60028]|uniref:AraC family transcriptional regulator n=1 Tax=Alsobacter ponti TaxID=2962936 RepID=A0ABT1LGH0_9HYPH|nr:AraC family transcriptional regulator [Alsobacter ponti]